jgi:CRP/FNR family cyclic AMP-dependent transcriptional regulator
MELPMPLLMETLKQVELFQGLTQAQLERLSALCQSRVWSHREMIFEQGDPADILYIIASGQIEIAVQKQGILQPEVYLGAGQIIGEMGLVDSGTRSASAIAAEDGTTVYSIRAEELNDLCEQDTALGYRLMRHIAQDLSFKLRHHDTTIAEQ